MSRRPQGLGHCYLCNRYGRGWDGVCVLCHKWLTVGRITSVVALVGCLVALCCVVGT